MGMCWQKGKPGDQPDWIASSTWHLVKQFTHRVQETIPRGLKLSTPSEWSQVTPRHNDSIFHLGVFSETRAHSGYPGKTGGRWQQTSVVRVSWHFPFQDLSSSVAMPVTDLTVQNSSFPWWPSTSSPFDFTSFSKTWVGCFEEQGRLWMAFGFLSLEVLQKHITLGQENCFCCPCENMPGIWQVTQLNTLYHCLDMLCKRSKKLHLPWIHSWQQASTGSGQQVSSVTEADNVFHTLQRLFISCLLQKVSNNKSHNWRQCHAEPNVIRKSP